MHTPDLSLIEFILPNDILSHFEVVDMKTIGNQVHVFLDEKNILPPEHQTAQLTSKGFHSESIIQDFPLRDKALFLHVRRRKWEITGSGEIVSRNWDLVAEGTRYSKEFAAFLKGLIGYIPDKFQ